MLKISKSASRVLLTVVISIFLLTDGFSQIAINSPYSRFGVGDLAVRRNTYNFSMGGVANAISSPYYINPYNPSANAAFDSLSFVFSGGLIGRAGTLRTEDLSNRTNFASLGYLLFGFPITHWLKTSIGLTPYSNVGYNIVASTAIEDVGNTELFYEGTGGLNEFYLNAAIQLHKNLAVGVKGSYMFGKADLIRKVFFPDSVGYINTRVDDYIEVGDMYFDFGIQYNKDLGKDLKLGLGAIYGPSQEVSATQNYLVRSFFATGVGTESFRDTIINQPENEGSIVIPDKYGVGFMLKKSNKWMVAADYNWQNWKDYKAFGVSDSLENSMQVSIGGEFLPSQRIISSYWKRIKYRLGFRYNKTYLNLRETQINEFGISFGMGLPIPRSLSTINLGIEVGRRGATASNLIQENFINITLGVSVWERWFVKSKYN
ncbi:MAG: hypothetical protein ACLFPE_01310 [Bacteroidales bacterium]